jgi:hypothetical protein
MLRGKAIPEPVRPRHQTDPTMPLFDQILGRRPHRLAIVRRDHVLGVVDHGRTHPDVATTDRVAEFGDGIIFADRWHQQHPEQPLPLQEMPQVVEHRRGPAIERPHDHLELGPVQRLEHALLHVQDGLRIGIVVDEPDKEIAAERQRARLRIGNVAELADHVLDPLARIVVEQRRPVDHPAHRLLGNPGDSGHIVDRRLTGLLHYADIADPSEPSCGKATAAA